MGVGWSGAVVFAQADGATGGVAPGDGGGQVLAVGLVARDGATLWEWFRPATGFHLDGLRERVPVSVEPVGVAAADAAVEGPHGRYRELGPSGESRPGPV